MNCLDDKKKQKTSVSVWASLAVAIVNTYCVKKVQCNKNGKL